MAKLVHQTIELPIAFYVVPTNGSYAVATYIQNEDGTGTVPDDAILATSSMSLAQERLDLEEPVVLTIMGALTPFHSQSFHLITPQQYKDHLRAWREFRVTGQLQSTNPFALNDFYQFCSRTIAGCSYITRQEWEFMLQVTNRIPEVLNAGKKRYVFQRDGGRFVFSVTDSAYNTQSVHFLSVMVDREAQFFREDLPVLFDGLMEDIEAISMKVGNPKFEDDGFNTAVMIYYRNGSRDDWRFGSDNNGFPLSHLEIFRLLKTLKRFNTQA